MPGRTRRSPAAGWAAARRARCVRRPPPRRRPRRCADHAGRTSNGRPAEDPVDRVIYRDLGDRHRAGRVDRGRLGAGGRDHLLKQLVEGDHRIGPGRARRLITRISCELEDGTDLLRRVKLLCVVVRRQTPTAAFLDASRPASAVHWADQNRPRHGGTSRIRTMKATSASTSRSSMARTSIASCSRAIGPSSVS